MKFNLKNVFLSVGITLFSLALFGFVSVGKADAAFFSRVATGNWNVATTWSSASCAGSPGATVPTTGDTVTICSGNVVTITAADAAATTLTLADTSTLTIDAQALTVAGVTTIGAGSTLTTGTGVVTTGTLELSGILNIGAGAFTASGATHIYPTGTLTFSSAVTGAKVFAAITVDAGGTWDESVAVNPVTWASLTNAGTVTVGTGTHTFNGTVTNTGTFYLYNLSIPIFAPSTYGTINYNNNTGEVQGVQVIGYNNLTLSGSGTKTLTGNTVIAGTLAISGTIVNLSGNSNAHALTIGGIPMRAGIWGALSGPAIYQNAVFAGDSSYVTVATSTAKKAVYQGDINPGGTTTTTTTTSNGTVIDITPPSGTSVSINAGALTTSSLSSTLTFTAVDATQMIVSSDAGFAGASWETYATSKPFAFAGADGVKTVYAKFRDATGNMSQAVSDSITVSGSGVVVVNLLPIEPTQGCSAGNLYNTSTGLLCVNNTVNPAGQIPGCGNRTTGFSTTGAGSCALNRSTTGVTYSLGTVTLKNGSKGDAVMELQRLLNQVLNLGLVVDGKLGPKTIAVIKTWQKNHNLVADGLVGKLTKAAMKLEAE